MGKSRGEIEGKSIRIDSPWYTLHSMYIHNSYETYARARDRERKRERAGKRPRVNENPGYPYTVLTY